MSLDSPAQMDVIKDAIIGPSPPSAATLNGLREEQGKRHPIWNGRPSMNRGIPIQLYHPSFAKFLRVVRDDTVGIDLKPGLRVYALAAIKEDKNEIGTGGCDPSDQCALGFRLYYAREEVRPFLPFLISVLN